MVDNPEALRKMLPRFEGVDIENGEGMTPLMIAVSRAGHDENAKSSKFRLFNDQDRSVATEEMLIMAGADPNRISSEGSARHRQRARVTRRKCALYLITVGADVALANKAGYSMLHAAAHNGNEFLLSKILDWYNIERLQLSSNLGVNVQNTVDHSTPLHFATSVGHVGAIEILLKNGADTKMEDDGRKTPLHLAVTGGNADAVVKLLEAAGDELDARDGEGATPLGFLFFKQGEGEDYKSMYIRIPDDGIRMRADILSEEEHEVWEEWLPLAEEEFYGELEAQDLALQDVILRMRSQNIVGYDQNGTDGTSRHV
ncbi:hypothetical protein EsH8_V_000001 [Colletotrichum jinshuiense]